jgi:hypothetical protein
VLIGRDSGTIAYLDTGAFPDTALIESFATWVPEIQTASWKILSWADDLGFTVQNAARPSGGRAAFLDAIGRQRNLARLVAETDAQYRAKIIAIADIVSPNAIQRAITRIFQPLGISGQLLEIGTTKCPGFFYDVEAALAPTHSFAYDMDPVLRPQDRWKTYFSLYESRAFFMVEIAQFDVGDFGISFDAHPTGAFDIPPYIAFFDGYGLVGANACRQLWADLDNRRAAGVAFDFVLYPDIVLPPV